MAKKEQAAQLPNDSDFEIDERKAGQAFSRLPALVAYWSREYADAFEVWKKAKLHRDTVHAKAYVRLRDEAEAERSKLTEATLKALVQSDVGYLAAYEAEILAETRKVRCQGYLDAFSTKRDALVSLGANQRAELGALRSGSSDSTEDDLDEDDD